MSTGSDFLYQEVLPYLDRARVWPEIEMKRTTKAYIFRCPVCDDTKNKKAFIYHNGTRAECSKGHWSETIAHKLVGTDKPTGDLWFQYLEIIGALVGKVPPARYRETSAQDAARYAKEIELDELYGACRANLSDICREYASNRGFTKFDRFGTFDMNLKDRFENLGDLIAGESEHKDFILQQWHGSLVFPIYDRFRHLKAIGSRAIHESRKAKYMWSAGADIASIGLAGLEKLQGSEVFIVEGALDAYLADDLGNPNFGAVLSSGFTKDRWEIIGRAGVKTVFICFDLDEPNEKTGLRAGEEGMKKAVLNADHVVNAPKIFVLKPENLAPYKDPDEFIRAEGVEKFVKLARDKAIHRDCYRAELMAATADLDSHAGIQEFIDKCERFMRTAAPKRFLELKEFFSPRVVELTNLDPDDFQKLLEDVEKDQIKKAQEQIFQSGIAKINEDLKEGGLDSAFDSLQNTFLEVQAARQVRLLEPMVTMEQGWAQYEINLQKRIGKEYQGLTQSSLPELNNLTDGLRKMICIAGPPGLGKTMIATQFAVEMMLGNPDVCCLFVSLEMSNEDLYDRLKSYVMGLKEKTLHREDAGLLRQVATERLRSIKPRLLILHDSVMVRVDIGLIEKKSRELKLATHCKHCVVVIDYFQVWPLSSKELENVRSEVEKADYVVDQLKTLRSRMDDDPLIVVSEARKPQSGTEWAGGTADIKGSGRLGYGSDQVYLINAVVPAELVRYIRLTRLSSGNRLEFIDNPDNAPEYNKKELAEYARDMQEAIKVRGIEYGCLRVDKCRGGTKGDIYVTISHKINRITEGLLDDNALNEQRKSFAIKSSEVESVDAGSLFAEGDESLSSKSGRCSEVLGYGSPVVDWL